MVTVWSFIEEGVEKIEDMAIVAIVFFFVGFVMLEGFDPLRMICVAGDLLQYFDLSHRKKPPSSVGKTS